MKVQILDGSGYLYRAYHALPALTDRYGHQVGAIYGFFRMLFKLIARKPEAFVIAWDAPVKTHRHTQFADYKATRAPTPDDLKVQIGQIKDLVAQLGIPYLEVPGYEADDIIATLCQKFKSDPARSLEIVSADKDLKQLIDKNVYFYDAMKDELIDTVKFITERKFAPKYMADYLAILGDASDNIPGVQGIGKKGAQDLVEAYGSLESIYEKIDELGGSIKEKLIAQKEQALMSKQLVQLMDVPEIGHLQISDLLLKIDIPFYKKILVEQCHFDSLGKTLDDLSKKIQTPTQIGLFG